MHATPINGGLVDDNGLQELIAVYIGVGNGSIFIDNSAYGFYGLFC